MMRKRSRLEIYLDILNAIKKGIDKPTRIMYNINLSWNPFQKILESMVSQGLIARTEEKKRKHYVITEKGRNVLRYFNKANELIIIKS